MPLRYCLLGSGSKGNALYVEGPGGALLVDCGLSARQVLLRLEARGLASHGIRAILITHEHRDHLAGARVLAKRLRCPVLFTEPTWRAALAKDQRLAEVRRESFAPGGGFELAGLCLRAFSLSHDAVDPVGLEISLGAARLGLATDLGQVTRLVQARLQGCQALVVESNHDPQMLAQGPYQEWLKQRVRSRQGHLSNQQGAELIESLHHRGLRQVVLAHLSETNNRPDLAGRAAGRVLERLASRAELVVAAQDRPTPVLEI